MTPAGLTAGAGVGVGAALLSPALVSSLASTPWWLAAALIMVATLCVFVRSVFPQESSHRLEWAPYSAERPHLLYQPSATT